MIWVPCWRISWSAIKLLWVKMVDQWLRHDTFTAVWCARCLYLSAKKWYMLFSVFILISDTPLGNNQFFHIPPSVLTILGMTHKTQKYLNHICCSLFCLCAFSLFLSCTSMTSHKYLPNKKIFKMQDDPQLRRWCTLEDDSGDRKGFWKLLPPDVRSFEESHITSSLPEHAVFFLSGDNFDSCLVISFIQGRRNVKWDRDRGSFQYLSTQRLLKI